MLPAGYACSCYYAAHLLHVIVLPDIHDVYVIIMILVFNILLFSIILTLLIILFYYSNTVPNSSVLRVFCGEERRGGLTDAYLFAFSRGLFVTLYPFHATTYAAAFALVALRSSLRYLCCVDIPRALRIHCTAPLLPRYTPRVPTVAV